MLQKLNKYKLVQLNHNFWRNLTKPLDHINLLVNKYSTNIIYILYLIFYLSILIHVGRPRVQYLGLYQSVF